LTTRNSLRALAERQQEFEMFGERHQRALYALAHHSLGRPHGGHDEVVP
jgi:hypothetical protein